MAHSTAAVEGVEGAGSGCRARGGAGRGTTTGEADVGGGGDVGAGGLRVAKEIGLLGWVHGEQNRRDEAKCF